MDNTSRSERDSPAENLLKLRRLARLAPRDTELRLALARELMERSLTDEAITELRTVIALSPNHLEARKLLEKAFQGRLKNPT